MSIIKRAASLFKDESGQTFIELGLVIIFVVLAAVVSVRALQTEGIAPKYGDITSAIQDVEVPDF